MRAIHVLWLRQVKRYFRSPSQMIGSLGQPILFLLSLGFGFGPTFSRAGHGDYMAFLTPGIVLMTVMFSAVFAGIEIIWDRQFGFLKETFVAPVSRLHIVLGKVLGGATVACFQGLFVLAFCLVAGFRFVLGLQILGACLFMFFLAVLFTAVGTAIACVLQDMRGFQLIMNFLLLPLFFFSNALFPIDGLPKPLQAFIRVNPFSYGVDGFRGSLAHSFAFGASTDVAVLLLATAAFIVAGGYLFNRMQL
jgi:ABC-2 type transport system permease protein